MVVQSWVSESRQAEKSGYMRGLEHSLVWSVRVYIECARLPHRRQLGG